MREQWLVKPGQKVDLAARNPSDTSALEGGRKAAGAALVADHQALSALQDRLWAESRQSLLVVLQGMDASGKDGTVKHVFDGVNPQGTRVTAFKEPTAEELGHDFLWRVHLAMPRAGEIGIFNRSHYEDVLVARVRKLVKDKVWKRRYGEIVAFEDVVAHGGTTIVKVFLHISRDEQRRRFEARLHDPSKRWKFRRGDLEDRALWPHYMAAYDDAIAKTSTKLAPWYVVPADDKAFRNWAVSRILIETLTDMNPLYPEPPDLDGLKIT